MNWNKIVANFFVVFFGTMVSVSFVGEPQAYIIAAINAFMLSGLAAAKEYAEECEKVEVGKLNGLVLLA